MPTPHERTFRLEIPPSTNQLFTTVPGGKRVKSTAYRQWQKSEKSYWMMQKKVASYPIEIEAIVHVGSINPVPKSRDLDNFWKATLDSMVQGGFIKGDSFEYIRKESIEWVESEKFPFLEIRVKESTK
jgi:Holliday junction resolvase RusA-like endonuclease